MHSLNISLNFRYKPENVASASIDIPAYPSHGRAVSNLLYYHVFDLKPIRVVKYPRKHLPVWELGKVLFFYFVSLCFK